MRRPHAPRDSGPWKREEEEEEERTARTRAHKLSILEMSTLQMLKLDEDRQMHTVRRHWEAPNADSTLSFSLHHTTIGGPCLGARLETEEKWESRAESIKLPK